MDMQPDRMTSSRDLLLDRLARLQPAAKRSRGYRTAVNLLGKKFLLAAPSTQLALLQAAAFMVDVLEKLPVT